MNFLKSFCLTIVLALTSLSLSAQPIDPVAWKTSVKQDAEGVYAITFSVSVDKGWHIYDLGPYEGGPMATTFILPFAIGACNALGGDVMTDAFGIVAMIAMTPLITIQVLGLYGRIKQKRHTQKVQSEFMLIKDDMIFYDKEVRS